MADKPAQSLAEGSAAAAIGRGPAIGSRPLPAPALAVRSPYPGVSSYAAWVRQNQPLPTLLGQYAPLPGAERW
jgi:hypothetical protein